MRGRDRDRGAQVALVDRDGLGRDVVALRPTLPFVRGRVSLRVSSRSSGFSRPRSHSTKTRRETRAHFTGTTPVTRGRISACPRCNRARTARVLRVEVVDAREHDDEVGCQVEIARSPATRGSQGSSSRESPRSRRRRGDRGRSEPRGPGRASSGASRSNVVEPPSHTMRYVPSGFGTHVAHVRDALAACVEVHDVARRLEDGVRPARHDEQRVRPVRLSDLLDEPRVGRRPASRATPPVFRAKRRAATAFEEQKQRSRRWREGRTRFATRPRISFTRHRLSRPSRRRTVRRAGAPHRRTQSARAGAGSGRPRPRSPR